MGRIFRRLALAPSVLSVAPPLFLWRRCQGHLAELENSRPACHGPVSRCQVGQRRGQYPWKHSPPLSHSGQEAACVPSTQLCASAGPPGVCGNSHTTDRRKGKQVRSILTLHFINPIQLILFQHGMGSLKITNKTFASYFHNKSLSPLVHFILRLCPHSDKPRPTCAPWPPGPWLRKWAEPLRTLLRNTHDVLSQGRCLGPRDVNPQTEDTMGGPRPQLNHQVSGDWEHSCSLCPFLDSWVLNVYK